MSSERTPTPLLARLPAGPIRESVRLLWDQINALKTAITGPATTASVGLTSPIAVTNGALTPVPWQTVVVAQGEGSLEVATLSTVPTRLTFPRSLGSPRHTPSVWLAVVTLAWEINTVGIRQALIGLTQSPDSVLFIGSSLVNPVAGFSTDQQVSAIIVNPAGGSYLEVYAAHDSGAPLNLNPQLAQGGVSRFTLTRLQ